MLFGGGDDDPFFASVYKRYRVSLFSNILHLLNSNIVNAFPFSVCIARSDQC